MSFTVQETDNDVKPSCCSDQDQVDGNSEASVTLATNVTTQSSTPEENSVQVVLPASETENVGRYDSSLASSFVEEVIRTVSEEIFELSVSDVKQAVSTQVISNENCATSSDVMPSGNQVKPESVAENTELCNDIVEPHSVVDITTEHAFATDEACIKPNDNSDDSGESGCDNFDVNSNVQTDASLLPADVSSVGCDSCSAGITSSDTVQDECSRVSLTSDVYHNESTENPAGLHTWHVEHKPDSKFVSPVRLVSTIDRKSRPVPLPRSNTFRKKDTSEVLSTVSSRNSIPVQYETCSSVLSKICQTPAFEDDCEVTQNCQTVTLEGDDEYDHAYSLPVDFSEIYVDNMTVVAWPVQNLSKNTTEGPSYDESEYDELREVTADFSRMMMQSKVVPFESDYDVLKENIWDDDTDACDGCETEILPGAGLPCVANEPYSDIADTWNDVSDVDNLKSVAMPSRPVDVC